MTTLSHRRFVDDLIQVVGLPVGARIRLRYRKPYVSDEVWSIALSGNATAWHAIIALGGINDRNVGAFELIRTGEIISAVISGEIIMLEIALAGYSAEEFDHAWREVSSLARGIPSGVEGGFGRGVYLQKLKHFPVNVVADVTVEGWERATDAVFRVDKGRNLSFLYFMQGAGSGAFAQLGDHGVLVVESGTSLSWDVHTKCIEKTKEIKNPIGEVTIEVSCHPMRMITSRRIRVDSRRDMRRMNLSCGAGFRSVAGHLSIRVMEFSYEAADPDSKSSGRSENSLSRHDIPLRAGKIMPIVASVAAAVAAGLAVAEADLLGSWADVVPIIAGLTVLISLLVGFRGKDDL
ncbi:hypothetical protein [Xanthomonas sp. XNM01]|uniref:hypothetical protein n=1 Tax=Xanthomonas sp. XNM01 TaxID=2769289 RepID=UPI00177EC4FA|nr:hypothetical protein [Xanthomonas sp. XNM01]MBD9370087.1 hypothetical protein [Xanthomonas sp. XNM01]